MHSGQTFSTCASNAQLFPSFHATQAGAVEERVGVESEESYPLCNNLLIGFELGIKAKVDMTFRMGRTKNKSHGFSYLLVSEAQKGLSLVVEAKARACHAPEKTWEGKLRTR